MKQGMRGGSDINTHINIHAHNAHDAHDDLSEHMHTHDEISERVGVLSKCTRG